MIKDYLTLFTLVALGYLAARVVGRLFFGA